MKNTQRIVATLLAAVALLLCAAPLKAADNTSLGGGLNLRLSTLSLPTDSLAFPSLAAPKYNFWKQRTTQMGFGLIGAGAILSSADVATRSLRHDYLPTFRYHYDDYLQYSPLAITYALRAFGIEGRNSWERALVTDAISAGIMVSAVYAVKYGLGRLRPDGSTYNSFPSGHTAMAFTAATILHKEYGTTVSPWWSIAGYSLATITGVSRALNNRHWLSDVVVGAGVGILSTELGYLIADRIFGTRGLRRPVEEWEPVRVGQRPSYVGIGVAHNLLVYDRDRYALVAPSSIGFSIEGAWFFSERLGVGGAANVGRYAQIVDKNLLQEGSICEPAPINNLSLAAGIFYNHPLSQRIHLGAKTLVGVARNHRLQNSVVDDNGVLLATIDYDNREHLTLTAGLSLRFVVGDNLGVRIYADYNYLRSDYSLTSASETLGAAANLWGGANVGAYDDSYVGVVGAGGVGDRYSEWRTPLTLGVAVDALLW